MNFNLFINLSRIHVVLLNKLNGRLIMAYQVFHDIRELIEYLRESTIQQNDFEAMFTGGSGPQGDGNANVNIENCKISILCSISIDSSNDMIDTFNLIALNTLSQLVAWRTQRILELTMLGSNEGDEELEEERPPDYQSPPPPDPQGQPQEEEINFDDDDDDLAYRMGEWERIRNNLTRYFNDLLANLNFPNIRNEVMNAFFQILENANARIIDGADPEEEERNILEQQHFLLNEVTEREIQRQRQEDEIDIQQPPARFSRLALILNDLSELTTEERIFAINSGQRSPEVLRHLKFKLLTSRIPEEDIYYLRGILERYPVFGDLIVPGIRRFL